MLRSLPIALSSGCRTRTCAPRFWCSTPAATIHSNVRVRARWLAAAGSRRIALPPSATLDGLAYKFIRFGFPVWTFGVICGAIWAEAAWGRFWGWDPKETVAFVSWVVYAAYLHARATAGWRGRPAAWINSLGFVLTVFNLFFINLVTTGLHSYAGVGSP